MNVFVVERMERIYHTEGTKDTIDGVFTTFEGAQERMYECARLEKRYIEYDGSMVDKRLTYNHKDDASVGSNKGYIFWCIHEYPLEGELK